MSFTMHRVLCTCLDFDAPINTFQIEGSALKFKNTRYMLRSPIFIYGDFQCLLENNREEPTSKRGRDTIFYAKHKPCSAAFYPMATFECAPNFPFETYTGTNVCYHVYDHLSWRYAGAAHSSWNLNYKFIIQVNVMIDNFR